MDCYNVSKNTQRPIPLQNSGVINEINSFHARHNPEKIFYQEPGRESQLNKYLSKSTNKTGLRTEVENKSGNRENIMLSLNQESPGPSPNIPFVHTKRRPQNKEPRFGNLSHLILERCRMRVDTVIQSHDDDIDQALLDTIKQIVEKSPSKNSLASWEPN